MTEVEIVNRAMIHLGVKARVASLSEASEQARHASALFDASRRATLREFDWAFARKRATLDCLSDDDQAVDYEAAPDDWAFVYAYPEDCITLRGFVLPQAPYFTHPGCADLLNLSPLEPPPYEVGLNSAGDRKIIYTDLEDAVVRYTSDVSDSDLFDDEFSVTFAWHLASLLALPLTGDKGLRQEAETGFAKAIASAKASSANEQVAKPDNRDASWVEARE